MSWFQTLTLRARELRKRATPAEDKLWKLLRRKTLHGLKFYRQFPIGYAIVDFYCPARKLVIELDGGIHDVLEHQIYDAERESMLRSMGLHILRFRNEEILQDIHTVFHQILEICTLPQGTNSEPNKTKTSPSPLSRREIPTSALKKHE